MEIASLAAQIQAEFESMIDPAYRERIQGLVPTTEGIAGVPVPKLRELAKQLAKEHPDLSLDLLGQLFDHFGQSRSREGMLIVTFWLTRYKHQFGEQLWGQIDRWVELIDNWETCDQLATNIGTEVVFKHPNLIQELELWTASPNPWRRRFAVAVTTALNQGGRSHPHETLRVCAHLMEEREVIVQKAVGWALRTASEKDPAATLAFLKAWQGRAQPRILREGSQKLPEAERKALLG